MPRSAQKPEAGIGDLIEISAHRQGDTGRLGEILAVLGVPGDERYLVRWDDDRQSIFYPGSDASIRRARKGGRP
jgi:hypothetical protein